MKSISALKVALTSLITVKCAFMVSCFMQLQLVARAPVALAEAQANDQRQKVLSYTGLALFVAALVSYFIWFYQSKKRSIALGAANVEYSPGLAVGCHFIPIGNLFMPFKAMSELWKASLKPSEWKHQRLNPMVSIWG